MRIWKLLVSPSVAVYVCEYLGNVSQLYSQRTAKLCGKTDRWTPTGGNDKQKSRTIITPYLLEIKHACLKKNKKQKT